MNWLICILMFVIGFAGTFSYRMGWWSLRLPTRKPKKSRLLPPLELAALEIECGLEPTWVPMPDGYARNDESLPPEFRPGGIVRKSMVVYDPAKDGPIIPLRPFLPPTTYANEHPRGSEPMYTCLTCHRSSSYPHTHLSCPGRKERR